MGTRERPSDRGRRRAAAAVSRLGEDHRRARVGAGLSLRAVGSATGTSHQQVRRFERGELATVDLGTVGAWCAVVGLDLVLRAYPGADPIRDAAQQRLLTRLRGRVHPSFGWRTEVPLGIVGDLRAWDAVIDGPDWRASVDAETALDDLQATERRIMLKAHDAAATCLLVVVADTRRNRRALEAAPHAFGGFERNARTILRSLSGAGRPPERGLLLL